MSATITHLDFVKKTRVAQPLVGRGDIAGRVKDRLGAIDGRRIAAAVAHAHSWYDRHLCTVADAVDVGVRWARSVRTPASEPPRDPSAA